MREPEKLGRVAAVGALPVFKRKLVANGSVERNQFGRPSTFWRRMVSGTRTVGNAVAMPREVRLRVKGGTVRPVNGSRFLTIPVDPIAYGKSIRQFQNVFFTRKGGRLFAWYVEKVKPKKPKGRRKRKGEDADEEVFTITENERPRVIFRLVTSATIRGKADLLPSPEEVGEAAQAALQRRFRER